MRKNIQEHSPKMPIIIVETKRKKQLAPPCKSQAIMVQSESSRGNRVPVGFPERKRKKRENKNMNNINTLTMKGEKIMPDFDNGIFRTIPHETLTGVVWLVRVADGERITFCRTQSDVMFCVGELMKQRLGL